jgi:16S rRNA (guanine527-N7)-methyltransferase
MDTARIAELLAPFLTSPLSPRQLDQISTYIDLLLRWNARTNLTAVRTADDMVTRHFGESLFAAQSLYPSLIPCHPERSRSFAREGSTQSKDPSPLGITPSPEGSSLPIADARAVTTLSTLFDLGSGAGFPGLPIHIWAPHLATTLIESQNKKVVFLREVIRALTLTNINVVSTRAEDLTTTAATVTLRAVERFDAVLPTAGRLIAPAGRLALLIAEPQVARAHAALPDFAWEPARPIPHSSARVLLIGGRPRSV